MSLMRNLLVWIASICLHLASDAQPFFLKSNKTAIPRSTSSPRVCGTDEYNRQLEKAAPENKKGRQEALQQIEQRLAGNEAKQQLPLVTIPVVVHVVYANAAENISDADIQSQIDVLNRDYRKLNSDIALAPSPFLQVSADIEIEFCLANTDPSGAASSGITRTPTTHGPFYLENDVKSAATGGHDVWDPTRYLNLWVCGLSSGLLGYAQFPGLNPATDGVVIDSDYFGDISSTAPYNKGRTATHEIGHYFDLRHIWGDEAGCAADDGIDDTPQQKGSNQGCPSFPNTSGAGSSCSGGYPGSMFMNYMDYTDDACMYMFTNGQKSRMRATLDGPRASLKTAASCSGTAQCDTLTNIGSSQQPYTLLLPPGATSWGYVAGHNSFGDRGKAEMFVPPNTDGKKIKGLFVYFCKLTAGIDTFIINTYQNNNGLPGTVMQTVRAAYASHSDDVSNDLVSYFPFSLPVSAPASFFGGVEYSYAANDTLGIFTTGTNTGSNTGFEKTAGGLWQPYSTPTSQGGWGFSLSHYIAAVLCDAVTGQETVISTTPETEVFPNPCSEKVFVSMPSRVFNGVAYLYDMSGRLSGIFEIHSGIQSLDIHMLPKGYYLLQVRSETHCINKKILVAR